MIYYVCSWCELGFDQSLALLLLLLLLDHNRVEMLPLALAGWDLDQRIGQLVEHIDSDASKVSGNAFADILGDVDGPVAAAESNLL